MFLPAKQLKLKACASFTFKAGGIHLNLSTVSEDRQGAGLHTDCAHAFLVVTPDVAVVEPFRTEIASVRRFTGADVFAKALDQAAQRAAVSESAPPTAPHRFMGEDSLSAVVVDKPDLAAGIDFHAGVAVHSLAEKEPAPVVGDDPDCLVDVLGALALQGEFVFWRG